MAVSEVQVRAKVEALLKELLGHWEMDDDHDYVVRYDSAVTFVRVRPMPSRDDFVINTFSPVARDIPNMKAKAELANLLLDHNAGVYFGKFGWHETSSGGLVVCEQAILASALNAETFGMALSSVVSQANDLDDEIVQRFGGKRWID